MSKQYEKTRDVWEFEKFLASKPTVWLNEANNLRLAMEALLLYDDEATTALFDKKEQPRLRAFFSGRIERMLMGFALENLVKAILLQEPDELKSAFSREGNLSWGKEGHNLIALLGRTNLTLSKEETFYLNAWQTCATWAGRYPIPLNENALPRQRKGAPTLQASVKRAKKHIEKSLREGDLLMGMELKDVIHTGVGTCEKAIFDEIFNRCLALLPSKGNK